MDHERYKLEDGLSTLISTTHELQRRALNAALKGNVSADTRRQMLSHLDTLRTAINKLPEAK